MGTGAELKKETEKKLSVKPVENKSKFSQAKLLAGAVKHRRLVLCIYLWESKMITTGSDQRSI